MTVLAHPRFLIFLIVAPVASVLAFLVLPSGEMLPVEASVSLGFDMAALAYLASVVPVWRHGTPDALRRGASHDRSGQLLLPVVAAVVGGVILCTLGMMMVRKSELTPIDLVLVVATCVLAWFFVSIVFALHYAHAYYFGKDTTGDGASDSDEGGLAFPGTPEPHFSDFCYFSLTAGMTFEASDVSVTSTALRKVVAIQTVLAFFYNIGVLALTINMLAGVL
jgi:uncharacterized membrane protein